MPNGVRCPHCGSSRLHRDGYTEKGAAKYHCLNCGRYFNDLTKTIFEHHKFTIEEMFYILKEMENKSTLQISKELGRKYDSVLAFVREVQEIAEKIDRGGNKFERPRRPILRRGRRESSRIDLEEV